MSSIPDPAQIITRGRLSGFSWVIALLGVLMIISLWVLVSYEIDHEYNNTIEKTSLETMNLAIAFDEYVRRIMADADKDLVNLKRAYEQEGASSPFVATYIMNTGNDPTRNQIAIYNDKGDRVFSSNKNALEINIADQEYFQVPRDNSSGGLYIGKPVQIQQAGQTVIPLTRRITKPDGTFAGIVYIGLKTSYFLDFYKKMNLGQDQLIALVGLDWIVRARQSGDNLEVGQNVTGSPLWKNVQIRPAGTYITNDVLDGIHRIVSYRVMPDYPLVFAIGKTTKVALAEFEQRKTGYFLGTSLFSLFMLGFFGLLIARIEKQRTITAHLERKVQERTEQVMTQHEELLAQHEELQQREEKLSETNITLINNIAEREQMEAELIKQRNQLMEINAILEEEISERQAAQEALRNSRDELLVREQQLKRYADEIAATNTELQAFINTIAHDFRSPMVNLKGFSAELHHSLSELQQIVHESESCLPQEVQAKVGELLNKEVSDAQQFIGSAVDRLSRMVDALLLLSRMGRREMKYQEVDLNILVDEVLRSHQHQVRTKNIQIAIGTLPTVQTDYLSMEQIIGNLIDNAIKYLNPNRQGKIAINCTENEYEYVLSIEDNGRGIPAMDLEKIFDPFRRSGKQDQPGEGLGLAYIRTLVRMLGGKVWCESAEGSGTRMSLTIPKKHIETA